MSEDGTPLPNRTEPMPVESRLYPDDDPDGRTYHYYIRQLLEELNAHTVFRDAYANRPDYTPQAGALYIPEEVGQPWAVGDGTGWNERDWTGANPTFSTATVETAPSAGADVVRKTEHDTKADADGGGTAELTNYASIVTDGATIERISGTVIYASNTIAALPDVEDAVNVMATVDDAVYVVGGENNITETLRLPGNTGDAPGEAFEFRTLGSAYISQADGEELGVLVKADTSSMYRVDVQVDGNDANQTANVIGVGDSSFRNSHINVVAFNCYAGFELALNTEASYINVFARGCNRGVWETEENDINPDENYVVVRGRGNDSYDIYKDSAGINHYHIESEAAGTNAVHIERGMMNLTGVIRTPANRPLDTGTVTAHANISNMQINSPQSAGIRWRAAGNLNISNSMIRGDVPTAQGMLWIAPQNASDNVQVNGVHFGNAPNSTAVQVSGGDVKIDANFGAVATEIGGSGSYDLADYTTVTQ